MKKNIIRNILLDWYNKNKRDLPWRKERDPYAIWLSEVILQQTRVDQGLPYYINFIEKYPTVHDLANAQIDDVLRTWQGLGYYSRARNLHKCARIVAEQYNGGFPQDRKELIKLPGIGPYTSAAIASLAFGKREAVVDGNVIRVITRLYGIREDISEKKTINKITQIVDEMIPKINPDLFNQAIMEFGALHCTPNKPKCTTCDFMRFCVAQNDGQQESIPVKKGKIKKKVRFFTYLVININGRYLLRKREAKDIWNGLFEFFLIETDEEASFDQLSIPQNMHQDSSQWYVSRESRMLKHLLSHQTIKCRFIEIEVSEEYDFKSIDWEGYQLYSRAEIDNLPKSILIDRYLREKKLISFKKHS